MDYKKMDIKDIIAWCKANNQVEWLKAEVAKEEDCKVYPRKKVPALDDNGEVIKVNGKIKMVSVADKDKPYTLVKRPISFITIKKDFASLFMPEILPKAEEKEKDPTFRDIIASL